ncbi:hypothetical protein [Thioalkalivibrio sp. ALJ7]|uniref:hypothetical protein n=1 Tax=Thioalkalivibrio sp. ALJ7 TaxID=1158756 RepID=UPI001E2859DF|nr:hypothetical protein [Thioalkalivibrio sp. ALJ7]
MTQPSWGRASIRRGIGKRQDLTPSVRYFFPEYVGPKPEEDGVPGHFFRAFFVDTGEFRLLDEEFLIEPVADEILFVHAHLEKMDTEGGRFQVAERNT